MKLTILFAFMAAGALAGPLHSRQNRGKAGKAGKAAKGSTAAAAGGTAAGAVTKGTDTLVFKEDGGVPGNECLTFRNNGEIVDAACVNTAADRQITPSTLNGQNVLLVQRSFTAGFRPDLVGKEACVGNNGTDFLAQDCATATDFVTFDQATGQLVSAAGACQSGHDSAAQLTIDPNGKTCATLTTTSVTATAP